jgi:5-hydroxyisourate hydrolase-like protein (transthyretin family)
MDGMVRALTLALLLGGPVTGPATLAAAGASEDVGANVGVGFWPWTDVTDSRPGDPAGFLVRLVSVDPPESELVEPEFELVERAGTWLSPPRGKYFFWLESPSSVSPFRSLIDYEPDSTIVRRSSPVVPAGTVRWASKNTDVSDRDSTSTVWMLQIDSHFFQEALEHEMIRAVPFEQAVEGVRMPAGEVVVWRQEKETGDLLALSPVVQVPALGVAAVTAEPPAMDKSAFVLTLVRPVEITSPDAADVEVHLVSELGQRLAPDAIVRGRSRLHVFWTDISPGDMTLEARGSTVGLATTSVRLRPGRVEHQEVRLDPLPSLEVSFILPPEFDVLERKLRIVDRDHGTFFEKELDPGQVSVLLKSVPAVRLTVFGVVGTWELQEDVDMRDWRPASVSLLADVVAVYGTVYYGSEPHAAEIVYRTGEVAEPLRVTTDAEGRYEALFFQPDTYFAEVVLDGRSLPFAILCEVESSGRIDLHTPANEFTFHVTDAVTGKPIEGVELMVQNRRADETKTVTSLGAVTDAEGRSVVHPMAAGVLEYQAKVEGYFSSAFEKEEVPESEEEFSRDIEIRLDPVAATQEVTLLLATGAPATGAELLLGSASGQPCWQDAADEQGKVEIPLSCRGSRVLIRHPAAGVTTRTWDGSETRWSMARLGPPLRIRALSAPDGDVVPWAGVVVWIEGIRLDSHALTWLTGSPVQGAQNGVLHWPNPPAAPVAVLVHSAEASVLGIVHSGAYDSQRTEIPYPWPDIVEVVAAQ